MHLPGSVRRRARPGDDQHLRELLSRLRLTSSAAAGLLVTAFGFAAGVGRLFDNSFLTHLTTGRLIWDGQGLPRVDPYTFTAAGDQWFAQSWLASTLYGGVDQLGGGTALRLQFAVSTAALAALGWQLTRPAGHTARRLVAVAPFLAVGVFGWSHRPYLIGYVCLAAVLLTVQRQLDARWLLAAGWIWLNAHGSWPLGLVALATLWCGRALDRGTTVDERRATGWFVAGLLLGAVNPYGPRLLSFPLVALERRDLFSQVKEWGPPTFQRPGELAFLAAVVLGLVAIKRRPTWRAVLTFVVFLVAALLSQRNIQIAALLFVPMTSEGLAGGGPRVPPLLDRAAPVLAGAVVAISLVTATRGPAFDQGLYPVEAVRWLATEGLEPTVATVVTQDFVGNWVSWRYGPGPFVFIDDRYELVPDAVADDYLELLRGERGWDEVLERHDADAVVWQVDRPLAALLEASPCWEVRYDDGDYVVAVPAGSCP